VRPRAVVSLGTNTTRLLVARQREDGSLEQLEHGAIGTRLGEDLLESGSLSAAAMERTLAAVARFAERVAAQGAEPYAIATSAMRRANNAGEFGAQAERLLGAPLRILDGAEEAAASFRGATASARHDGVRRAVLDVGGGSTECAVGVDGRIERTISLEIGSVRLTERFPDLGGAAAGARARAAEESARASSSTILAPLAEFRPVAEVRTVAGTPLTLGAIVFGATANAVSGRVLTREAIDNAIDRLLELDLAARKLVPGMIPQRADVLPAGGLIVSEALRLLGNPEARLEVNDLLLGFLMGLAKTQIRGMMVE
jgi:exopolyphosphatase / guanosine-5'-triphosphate,3'-diphosphate pyrophosphatase